MEANEAGTGDGRSRCGWCLGDAEYQAYHDQEWGVPLLAAGSLFRLLSLETMQAGLAWITVLRKRTQMDLCFHDFSIEWLAGCGEQQIVRWLNDSGLIRHRGKLEALINNAKRASEEPEFAALLWSFAPPLDQEKPTSVPSLTAESKLMSKTLKAKGFKFVGPTTCYAFMQSAGMVNDHHPSCWRYEACQSMLQSAIASRPNCDGALS